MRVLLATAALALLSGCATNGAETPKPASIGSGPNQLRRAPCACVEIKQKAGLPAYLINALPAETAAA